MGSAERHTGLCRSVREGGVILLDVMIALLLGWYLLRQVGLVHRGHQLELLGQSLWIPGLKALAPIILVRLLLTPGLVASLGLHRRRWTWTAAMVALAGIGLGVYLDRTAPHFFPAGRTLELSIIREGYLRLYRHYPEYVPGFTRPREACALETYRFFSVGTEPRTFSMPADRLELGIELLYGYANWQEARDPSASLRNRDAQPARIVVEARPRDDQPWVPVATELFDPRDRSGAWFGPPPPGQRWLQWNPLAVQTKTASTAGDRWELRVSAEGPGAQYVVLAATDNLREPANRASPTAPRHIILISLDTLAAGHVGHLGYPRHTTPRLDAFAKANVTFTQALAAAPWTMPSHWSLLTGVTPSFHGMLSKDSRPDQAAQVPTLAELLQQAGYRTAAITGGYYVSANWGLHRGFDYFREFWHTWVPPSDYRKDVELNVLHAVRWVDQHQDEPFFLFFHTYQPHDPLLRVHAFDDDRSEPRLDPETGRVSFPDHTERERLRYDSEIRYTDRWLGHLLDALDSRGLLDEALVIVTSDHGENFRLGELGFDLQGRNRGHGFTLCEDDLRVPLVVHCPQSWQTSPKRIDSPASLVDVFWTVLSASGVTAPELAEVPPPGRGVDLLPMIRDPGSADPVRTIVCEADLPRPHSAVARRGNYKLVRTRLSDERGVARIVERLFDLASDPAELTDLSRDLPGVTTTLGEELEAHYRRAPESPFGVTDPSPASSADLDAQTRRQLESIGYIQ